MSIAAKWHSEYERRKRVGASAASQNTDGAPVDSPESGQEDSVTEPTTWNEQVAAAKGAGSNPTRCFISIESRRRRLIDPRANLYGGTKCIEDACVYAGILFDDKETFSEGAVYQTKVKSPEPEETIIRIWKIDNL